MDFKRTLQNLVVFRIINIYKATYNGKTNHILNSLNTGYDSRVAHSSTLCTKDDKVKYYFNIKK